MKAETVTRSRSVQFATAGRETSDGAGVKLTRVLTQQLQRRLDPFLMLDAFASDDPDDYIGGFPDHPHRGFEAVTYMVAGRMRHRDSAGHEGLLESGGMQWMTAGRGAVHAEIPEQEEGIMEGFQLWLNLPAAEKMTPPWYRDFSAADLPRFIDEQGVEVVVLAGESHGMAGAVNRAATQPIYLDLHLPAGSSFAQPIPTGHNAFLYVYRGEVGVAGQSVAAGHMAVLSDGSEADGLIVNSALGAKVLLIAGRPLNEPIAQYGPFVMNTDQQIYEAISDFRNGRL